MIISRMNAEMDVRHRYNRRVLFCIRIKGTALLIGLWDLFIHLAVLCVFILVFRQTPKTVNESIVTDDEPMHPLQIASGDLHSKESPNILLHNKNFLSSSELLNRILEKRTTTRLPMEMNARGFHSKLDLMTIKWVASLKRQDKCFIFFVVFSTTILIMAHIYGVLTNKAAYIVPYFLIKVFNVIVSILSMLGFYAYMSDIKAWVRMQPYIPLKEYFLELDSQTLQLVVFAFLIFVILAKLYIAAIIWYCYSYITALTLARNIRINTNYGNDSPVVTGDMYSPPKYEEAIKSNHIQQDANAPPPYTPLFQSTT